MSKCQENEPHKQYSLFGTALKQVSSQRDLGVIESADLSWNAHHNNVCKKAYNALHLIKRNIPVGTHLQVKKQLYMTLVRSHLSHCVQIWKPRLVKDITTLERIQSRATKFILNDYTIDYKARLQKLHLLPLGLWFDLHDLLFLVKCLNDEEDNIEIGKFVRFSNSRTRAGSSGLMLQINYTRTSTARHFYFNRVARTSNMITPTIIFTDGITSIKTNLKRYLWTYFDQHFDPQNTCTFSLSCPCSSCHSSGLSSL